MLLRRGSIIATGKVDEVFTAELLSKCFGLPLKVEREDGRWHARAVMA